MSHSVCSNKYDWWVDIPFGQILFIFDPIHCLILHCKATDNFVLSQPAHYPYIEKSLGSKTTWLLCIYGDLCAGYSSECH